MNRYRCLHPIPIFVAICLFAVACADGLVPTDVAPQFHEKEDPEKCDLEEVDCVAELDKPAFYTKSKNMHLMGFSARTVPNGTSSFNTDLAFWGRTAYQGTYSGFRIIDISQPDNPTEVLHYTECESASSTAGNQGDLVVWNNLLIRSWNSPAAATHTCAGELVGVGFEGLHVFDVSNPSSPQLLASVDLTCGSHTAMGVPDPANNRLWIYSSPSSSTCPVLDIVEIPLANPAGATYVRSVPAERACHDGAVILGSVQLLACAGGNGVTVWSLSAADGGSLENPWLLYSKFVTGVAIGHSAAFTWDGAVLVFGAEPGGGGQAQCQATSSVVNRSIHFFAARTGEDLGTFVMPRPQTAQENCTWHNYNIVPTDSRYILVSGNYQSGISVVDFTNPASAREIAFADPAPIVNPANPAAIVLGGDWSSYWYNGFIYESDIRRGLLVWRLNDPAVAAARKLDWLNPQTQETSSPLRGR
jgi:hypothetical protein